MKTIPGRQDERWALACGRGTRDRACPRLGCARGSSLQDIVLAVMSFGDSATDTLSRVWRGCSASQPLVMECTTRREPCMDTSNTSTEPFLL